MAAYYGQKLVIIALVLAFAITIANGDLCRMTKEGLKSCQPSVNKQNPVPPSAACCSAIAGADIPCLCDFKGSSLLSFMEIDSDLAMQLPAKCNLGKSFHCN
ncbi:hypothetical protein UlMin_032347 [Ulmus minor]